MLDQKLAHRASVAWKVGAAFIILTVSVGFAQAPASGPAQANTVPSHTSSSAAAKTAAAAGNAVKPGVAIKAPTKQWRTPWGDPDLQGEWSNATTTPLERPAKYRDKEFLTPEEQKAANQEAETGHDKRGVVGTADDVEGAYNAVWYDFGHSDGRTSLIYDPKDGRKPPLTEDGKRRMSMRRESVRTAGPYNGPEDLDLMTRCIARAVPRLPGGYDNNSELVQAPGLVSITQEQIHETRVIPLDGRPHLDSSVRQWLGDSRGHWEGSTLVVETTNFNERTSFQGSSKNMRLTERWTRLTDDTIDYRFTIDDPQTWTQPWSAAFVWSKGGTLFEYACHEDNIAAYGILAGARADEKRKAAAK